MVITALLIALMIVVPLGAILYTKWRRHQDELTWPTTWVHVGTPPPGIEKALEVIQRNTPGMPQAGTIQWIVGPFPIDLMTPKFLVAGTVDTYRPIKIRLMYFNKPESTALSHELGHVWSALTNQGFGESYGIDHVTGKPDPRTDARFVAWFTDVNKQIAQALGRG